LLSLSLASSLESESHDKAFFSRSIFL
jgi:hypothetical protein